MAISYISGVTANAATVALGTHDVGDLILGAGYVDANATVPTLPPGWTTRVALSNSQGSVLIAYKHAQSSADSFGNWTTAGQVYATVWRGGPNTLIFPNYISTGSATNTTISYGAQTAATFQTGAVDQALFSWVVNRNVTNVLNTPTPMTAGLTATNGSTWQTRFDYQLGRTTIWPATTTSITTSSLWRTFTLSLVESIVYGITGTSIKTPLWNPYIR
jgi:hypothetical protein